MNPPSQAIRRGPVFTVYVTDAGEIVGIGSLGPTLQRWRGPKDPPIPAMNLPFMGVVRRYWHQPPGPPEDRFAAKILRRLIGEAMKERDT
jgi:hypothetical protein